jgi:predicted SprT family Zn-dependent metalloprotease
MKDNCMASYTPDPHTIGVCPQRHRFLTSVIKSVLHEIIHMTNHLYGHSYLRHDKYFKDLRKNIADELGFDENEI